MKNSIKIFLITTLISFKSFSQTTYAVVVGVTDYQNAKWNLHYSDKDADEFVRFLQSNKGGNVPANNILKLTNSNATKASILEAMDVFQYAKPEDKIYFFFSGHGGDGVFVPHDANIFGGNMLSHDEVKAAFKKSKALNKICIADACLSGGMKNNAKSTSKAISLLNFSKSYKDYDSQKNIVVILSSRSNQLSQERPNLKEGAFTYYLLKGLYGNADKNKDKVVTVRESFNYMSPRVKKETNYTQAPIIYGKFSNNLVLSNL